VGVEGGVGGSGGTAAADEEGGEGEGEEERIEPSGHDDLDTREAAGFSEIFWEERIGIDVTKVTAAVTRSATP